MSSLGSNDVLLFLIAILVIGGVIAWIVKKIIGFIFMAAILVAATVFLFHSISNKPLPQAVSNAINHFSNSHHLKGYSVSSSAKNGAYLITVHSKNKVYQCVYDKGVLSCS